MKLTIAEFFLGGDALLGGDGIVVFDNPLVAAIPLRQVIAIEENQGIGGRTSTRAGLDDLWFVPLDTGVVLAATENNGKRKNTRHYDEGAHEREFSEHQGVSSQV